MAQRSSAGRRSKGAWYSLLPIKGGKSPADGTIAHLSDDDKNLLAIIELVRAGVSVHDFNEISKITPFSQAEWAGYLQVSERTMQRNQKEQKPWPAIQSERIIELTMLYQYGVSVFGDQDAFNTWLGERNIALGGYVPKELLDTKFGVTLVKDALGRIEHGLFA
ncbi:DUF2384 domain-containing protein [Flaviaesturariibacter flavus]|uniref:DUF2384 domain-containing protein n=1 Tax=Flaviaesturariibacter flavus TaxID=2502780 RepID=A0A4R1B7A1_9BACT|nr:antitoxin Xre/MbcA/ParS toxin-binding domain-containing protein [Flaviaesturariibacter flavus]TCJ12075.1 DUF2384 domain-containing protein [Flaviaesturariibacter flavus]